MNKGRAVFQIGKNGLTEGFLENLKNAFFARKNIKISVLKAAGHTRETVKETAEKIVEFLESRKSSINSVSHEIKDFLENRFIYRIVGFTIFLKKLRKL